jgi:WD40 repeat protein
VEAFDPATKTSVGRWSNSGAEFVSGLASLDALAVGRGLAAVGARNGAVVLLDAGCKFTDAYPASGDPVLAVALAPDESLVAAGTQNGKLRLIRPADRTELPAVEAHPGGVTAVSISRDGTLLATGGRDRAVRLWKRSGDRFEPLLTVSDLPDPVRELQFSPSDGRLLVLLSHEHAVRVWDIDRLKGRLGELKLGW